MLFNSLHFLYVFLPITLLVYLICERFARAWLTIPLIIASLVFYASSELSHVSVISGSVLFNFIIGLTMLKRIRRGQSSRLLFLAGIICNLLALGYFKYLGFFQNIFNLEIMLEDAVRGIALPLAISFFTFQQISFLIDVRKGSIKEISFLKYAAFVLFFPQLIAGPIVKFREMAPQFANKIRNKRSTRTILYDLLIGLSYLSLGLFKKVIIADGLAQLVDPTYRGLEAGQNPTLIIAWLTTLCFSFQIYFDFSAYSDMAIGLGRLFGYRLPVNFISPFRATNIVDFWARWHTTLTRFFNTALYLPISTTCYRYVINRTRNRYAEFCALVVLPVSITFILIGLWHGAGWNFVLFGLFQATLIIGYRAFTFAGYKFPKHWVAQKLSIAITFLCFAVSLVYFRSPDLNVANQMFANMFNPVFLILPSFTAGVSFGLLEALGLQFGRLPYWQGANTLVQLMTAAIIAFSLPNLPHVFGLREHGRSFVSEKRTRPSYLILGLVPIMLLALSNMLLFLQHEPAFVEQISTIWTIILALAACGVASIGGLEERQILWRPNLKWGAITTLLLIISSIAMVTGNENAFIYFEF